MTKLILFAVSFLFAAAGAYAQQASTGTADAGVPIEEYVPKVIIEGKWGAGPGEFGRQVGYEDDDVPSSLAVDSSGNIYVLDYVNNRIQKFSKEGKYLLSLPVDGYLGEIVGWDIMRKGRWFEERSRPEGVADKDARPIIKADKAIGINIVIDSKDILYYYLNRINDGKESGEVWQFRNDKLLKRMKPGEEKRLEDSVSDFEQEKTASGVRVKFARNKKPQELAISRPINIGTGEKFKVYAPMVRGDKTIIKTGVSDGKYARKADGAYVMEERSAVNYVLSSDGKLSAKISGNLPFDITAFDKELNGYALKTGAEGLTVIKYELTGVTK